MKLNECSCGCGGSSDSCMSNHNEGNLKNYMFFNNLKTIKNSIEQLMELDPEEVDRMLSDEHDWASDHIATSKDDIVDVADFFINAVHSAPMQMDNAFMEEQYESKVLSFSDFVNEALKKEAGERIEHTEFAKIKKGDTVIYSGSRYKVAVGGEYVLELEKLGEDGKIFKDRKGETVKIKVNYNMFNKNGAIPED